MTSRPEAYPSALPNAETGNQVVRVSGGALTVAARDEVAIASEADRLVLTAATEIVLQVGQSTFTLRADGTILLDGRRMTLTAPSMIALNPGPVPDPVPEPGAEPGTTPGPRG